MQIIFLNAWNGSQAKKLKDFIIENKNNTDIFCFQESSDEIPHLFCQDYLSDDYQFFSDQKRITPNDVFFQATFIKKNISVLKTQTIGQGNLKIGLTLLTQIKTNKNKILNICNVHGYPWPGDKQDNLDRLHQSQLIIDSLKAFNGPKIIGGDFNLDRDIKSTQLFEENGYRSLIKDFNITNTRNENSWKDYDGKQHFADHLFVTKDLKIKNFTVPYNEISDHLPLILEFNL
jgi:endonuclease/exonuclease/phosphatase (EEP) superfamily protein YafD